MDNLNAASQTGTTSNTGKYDLAVAYRVCSIPSRNPPPIFAEDKLKLAELCLKSFKASIGNLRVKMWVILTGPPEYEKLFTDLWPKADLEILNVPRIGNPGALKKQIEILTEQTDADLVCLAEDDYFYQPRHLQFAVDFFCQNSDAGFVSLYDHPDYYNMEVYKCLPLPKERSGGGGLLWRSRACTTHSFLARKETLQACGIIFRTMHKIVLPDTGHWLALTKTRIFNPLTFLRYVISYRYWAVCMMLSWLYCWRQILFGKRYTLWVPSPSIATHMVAGQEAPGVDWRSEFDQCLTKV